MLWDFDEFTAFHEAGHAVVAYVCGWPIRSITIEPDPSRGAAGLTATWFDDEPVDLAGSADLTDPLGRITPFGRTEGDPFDLSDRVRRAFARRIALYRQFSDESPEWTYFCDVQMVAAAGHEACVRFITDGYDYWTETERQDRATLWAAARCMARMTGGSVLAVRGHWTLQSGRLIRLAALQRGVAVLAAALLQWRTLDGVQVDGLLCDIVPTGRRWWDPGHRAAPATATGWQLPAAAWVDRVEATMRLRDGW